MTKRRKSKLKREAWANEVPLLVTERGFVRGDFKDVNGEGCSVQESSSMGRILGDGTMVQGELLWLGQNEGTHHLGECMARMHLSRPQAAALSKLLGYFADTGRLPRPRASTAGERKGGERRG